MYMVLAIATLEDVFPVTHHQFLITSILCHNTMPLKHWKSAVCTCGLRPEPHTVYSKKIYAEHLRYEARLRAGGLSVQAHSRSSSEAIIDSPFSNNNTGSENANLDASNSDVIMASYIKTSVDKSESETCSSSTPEIRFKDTLNEPMFDMAVSVDDPAFSEFKPNTGSGNSTDSEAEWAHWTGAIAGINISDICNLSESESNTGIGIENSTDSEAERAHWTEAIASINISDICDLSESNQPDGSELDDLEDVG